MKKTIYYLITYKSYGKTRRAAEIFHKIKNESLSWDCFTGNRNSMQDLIKFKYEDVENITKTTSFKKYINFC